MCAARCLSAFEKCVRLNDTNTGHATHLNALRDFDGSSINAYIILVINIKSKKKIKLFAKHRKSLLWPFVRNFRSDKC